MNFAAAISLSLAVLNFGVALNGAAGGRPLWPLNVAAGVFCLCCAIMCLKPRRRNVSPYDGTRCKECENYNTSFCNNGTGWCEEYCVMKMGDGYCEKASERLVDDDLNR